jgi:hypothetical protein
MAVLSVASHYWAVQCGDAGNCMLVPPPWSQSSPEPMGPDRGRLGPGRAHSTSGGAGAVLDQASLLHGLDLRRFELPGVAGQAGTTAIASISTRKSGWARPLTTAAVMTGGLGWSPHTRWNAAQPGPKSWPRRRGCSTSRRAPARHWRPPGPCAGCAGPARSVRRCRRCGSRPGHRKGQGEASRLPRRRDRVDHHPRQRQSSPPSCRSLVTRDAGGPKRGDLKSVPTLRRGS